MTTTASTPSTYAVDPAHSSVEFVVRHMMIAKVRGRFTGVTGTISVAPGSTTPTSIEATIDIATISTGDETRDGHLKSPDFFDVATHPTMTFQSTSVETTADGFDLHGHLTLHGTTQPIVLATTYEGTTVDPWGNTRLGYEAHAKLSRKEFGLVWNQALEAGGVAVSDEVKIELSIEAVAQK